MQGHVRKREGKRGSSWAFVVELPHTADGKRRQKWQSGFRTRKEAQTALNRVLSDLRTGDYQGPSKLPLSDLLDQWLRDVVKPNRGPATYDVYNGVSKNHLKPTLGGTPLSLLTAAKIQEFLAAQLARGLTRKTVSQHRMVLRLALAQAVKWELLPRNPVELVDGPGKDDHEKPAYDTPTIKLILAAVADTPLYTPTVLGLSTGLRRGEVLGLRWSDVDLAAGSLSVRQALSATSAGLKFLPPKTRKARRTIPLPSRLVTILIQHRKDQQALRDACPCWTTHDLVFPREDGRPWHPSTFTSGVCNAMKRAGIKATFHGHRHTHISQLLAAGVPVQVVSERVGHAKTSTTFEVYGHLMPGQQDDAARKADEEMRRFLE